MNVDLRALVGNVSRRAITLVEMLIAMALTLILVYAIAEFYARIGPSVKDGRAMIDLVAQLRTASSRLRADLELITVPMGVFRDDGSSPGYFTIREGGRSDADADGNGVLDASPADLALYQAANASTMLGDSDDFLAFTARSDTVPLTGQVIEVDASLGTPLVDAVGNVRTRAASSTVAEIAWWTSFNDQNGNRAWNPAEPRFLQRRQLLVAPEYNVVHPGDVNFSGRYYVRVNNTNAAEAHYLLMQESDVSVRPVAVVNGYTYFLANTLLDLTRRENRFLHTLGAAAFPNGVDLQSPTVSFSDFDGDRTLPRSDAANDGSQWRWVLGGTRQGEDRILANVLSFDIRVFDPTAPIRADNTDVLYSNGSTTDDAQGTVQPGDPGWPEAVNNSYPVVGAGAYVDLFYNRPAYMPATTSVFSGTPAFNVGLPAAAQTAYLNALGATYDTWALSYERDGINQDFAADGVAQNNPPFDEGTDGFDNNNQFGVDDPLERETTPPYAVALRGIQVRLRAYEPTTRQVRQATIGWDFISE